LPQMAPYMASSSQRSSRCGAPFVHRIRPDINSQIRHVKTAATTRRQTRMAFDASPKPCAPDRAARRATRGALRLPPRPCKGPARARSCACHSIDATARTERPTCSAAQAAPRMSG
jgi:hypothetical protein